MPGSLSSAVLSRRSALLAGALGVAAVAGCTSSGSASRAGGSGGTGGTGGSVGPGGSAPSDGTGSGSGPTSSGGGTATGADLARPADVVTGLDVPWSVVVLPDRSVLVSERESGLVKHVVRDGSASSIGNVAGVDPGGEGGLLGLAIDRRTFAATPVLYAYFTSGSDNRVVTIALTDGRLGRQTTIVDGIPKGSIHNGGRLAFGPDGFLYVTTGETAQRGLAQDLGSLGGKILRVTTDGQPAPGNPFPGSRVWSYGHRNVQGIAWGASGVMWASEFGQDTWDELNVIQPGRNYGWPEVEGIGHRSEYVDPVRQWPTADASPSGICIGPDGAVLMAALRGESLWKVPVAADGSTGEPVRLLHGDLGRLRDVLVGPDGFVWVVTNNTARGTPRSGDDRIVRLPHSVTG